jgi:polysaccharide pyruvyl transferase WcaK-like protein
MRPASSGRVLIGSNPSGQATSNQPSDLHRPSSATVVLLHAFNADNVGDGFLVDESLRILSLAGVAKEDCCVVAINARTFDPSIRIYPYPVFGRKGLSSSSDLVRLGVLTVAGLTQPAMGRATELGAMIRGARLVVGVGGGYLNTPSRIVTALNAVTHVPQLAAASASRASSLYLPQSVGRLSGPVGSAIRRHASKVSLFCARDDLTPRELPGSNVMRCPDLAVLRIARDFDETHIRRAGQRFLGIARDLAIPNYVSRLRSLSEMLAVDWVVHCSAKGQDDSIFYTQQGMLSGSQSLVAFQSDDVAACVSVRLHGALQAILAGIPTIHLSYDRKGQGAYSDLGLDEWVHDVRTFSPALVAAQAQELAQDPTRYWEAVSRFVPRIRQAEAELVERAADLLRIG